MYQNQYKTYDTIRQEASSGRVLEASVLGRAAQKLKDCQDRWNSEDRESQFQEALRFNQMIWTIFQGELTRKDNPLPKEIKEQILTLSTFVDKTIFETMAYPAPEKLSVLININQNIAAGLMSSPDRSQP
jgi:flagellar biosynthesis activator protein FlaF